MLDKYQEPVSVILIVIFLIIIAHELSGSSISCISRKKVKNNFLLASFHCDKSKIQEVKVRNSNDSFDGSAMFTEALVLLIFPSIHFLDQLLP